ncbi:hypothetical protein D3C75_1207490 [compost metagenome]
MLRIRMPARPVRPSRATKPNGWSNSSSASTAPIRPNGAVASTMKVPEKERICSMMRISMKATIAGCSFWIEASALPDSSTAPAVSMR